MKVSAPKLALLMLLATGCETCHTGERLIKESLDRFGRRTVTHQVCFDERWVDDE
jgi:hypothetical protein